MKNFSRNLIILTTLVVPFSLSAQQPEPIARANKADLKSTTTSSDNHPVQKVVVVTGARFSYKLIQKWIDDYSVVKPDVQIIIDARGSSDPAHFDILAEVYEQDQAVRRNREYLYIGRYAILPVANSKSAFAKTYGDKGLNRALINQIFFHDIFSDKDKEEKIKDPYTVYTRLQKAGAPIVFTRYFGYEQKDIKGKAIAGSDEHLIKAMLRDSTAVSYLPMPLIYDPVSKKPLAGIAVLPVDFNDNGRVNDEEKFYSESPGVIEKLEGKTKDIRNVPLAYLHLSVEKETANPEAIAFLKWVSENGKRDLHDFGYLNLEERQSDNQSFFEFAAKRINE